MSKEREQGIARANDNDISFPGDNGMRVPPVPIPNTEVKPHRAESTWRATAWEDRSSPGVFLCLNLYCKCSSKKFLCPRVCIIDARAFFDFVGGES